jgi:hypothetical protein
MGQMSVEVIPNDADVALADRYHQWADHGAVVGGRRVSICCAEADYRVGDEIRIVHAMEVIEPGHDVFVMGPKEVFDEYVDDVACGRAGGIEGIDPFSPAEYDGRVAQSPAVDTNFMTTVHTFSDPGDHEFSWRPGSLRSNVVRIHVV